MTPYRRGSTMAGAPTPSFPGQAGESIDPAFKGKDKETAPPKNIRCHLIRQTERLESKVDEEI
jgi:hypothetical protein